MCQSKAEGGARCAAHTRPAFTTALTRLAPVTDATTRARIQADALPDIAAHAATPTGSHEVQAAIQDAAQHDPDTASYLRLCAEEGTRLRDLAAAREAQIHDALTRAAATPAPTTPLTLDEVTITRPDSSGRSKVLHRNDRSCLGTVVATTSPTGKKAWAPATVDGTPLTYAVTVNGPPAAARTYPTRNHAVQSLLNEQNTPPGHWEQAPTHDWSAQTYPQWGHTFTVGDTLRGKPLLHGSPHPLPVGAVLLPDQAPTNFTQSDPFAVSLTTEPHLARAWAADTPAAKERGTYYVYEVEPLTPVKFWQWDMAGWDLRAAPVTLDPDKARLILKEGRVSAARIVAVHQVDR